MVSSYSQSSVFFFFLSVYCRSARPFDQYSTKGVVLCASVVKVQFLAYFAPLWPGNLTFWSRDNVFSSVLKCISDISSVKVCLILFEIMCYQCSRSMQTNSQEIQAGRRHGLLVSMSLCKYRSSAHLLKLTRTSIKLTGKLVCDWCSAFSIHNVSSNSAKYCRRSILKNNHDVNIMTSSGHVTSSGAWAIDSP